MKTLAERITVLHYVHDWLPQTENWSYDQVTQLPQWVDNHVFCEATLNLDQFAVRNLNCLSDASALRWYWDKGLRKLRIRNYLGYFIAQARRINPHIIHSHFGSVGWANRRAVEQLGTSHLVTFYGFDVNMLPVIDPRWRARYRDLFASVDRVLCEGPHMARCIVELGCPEEKVRVHHIGVRVEEIPYRPRSWQPGTPLRALIAATFREKKGIPYALAALGALQREVPVQVTVIGDSTAGPRSQDEKAPILAELEKHGLMRHTRLLGFCTYRELMKEAYDHHVFLSPSVTAINGDTEGGAPVAIIHMAASGMPIVSTRHCDIPSVLPASAELAEERDVAGLVHRLRWLVENAGNWEPELALARQHVELNFNARTQGQRLASIYAEVAGIMV